MKPSTQVLPNEGIKRWSFHPNDLPNCQHLLGMIYDTFLHSFETVLKAKKDHLKTMQKKSLVSFIVLNNLASFFTVLNNVISEFFGNCPSLALYCYFSTAKTTYSNMNSSLYRCPNRFFFLISSMLGYSRVLIFRVEYESSITRFLKLMLEHFSSRVFFTEPSRVPGYLIARYSTSIYQ